MPLLRFLFRPATALGVAMAVFAALLVARTARDLVARFTDAGVPVLEVEYERVFRGAAGRRPRLVETGTHFIADDGRYRRDATALAAPDGAVRRRTSEIWLPPEGAGLDAGAPMEIGVAPDRAPVERIAIDRDTGRAVRGPLEFAWQSPSEYAALLRGDAPAPTSPEPEQAGLPRPEPVYVDSPAESLGWKTIGPMRVRGTRRLLPMPGEAGPITIESWEAVQLGIRRPLPIVVERYVKDFSGNGYFMRVKSVTETDVRSDFFDVPAACDVQDPSPSRHPDAR